MDLEQIEAELDAAFGIVENKKHENEAASDEENLSDEEDEEQFYCIVCEKSFKSRSVCLFFWQKCDVRCIFSSWVLTSRVLRFFRVKSLCRLPCFKSTSWQPLLFYCKQSLHSRLLIYFDLSFLNSTFPSIFSFFIQLIFSN